MVHENFPFKEIELTSFDKFDEVIKKIRLNRPKYFIHYRGQSDSNWSLIPPLFRNIPSGNNLHRCIEMLLKKEFEDVSNFLINADRMGFSFAGNYIDLLNYHLLQKEISFRGYIQRKWDNLYKNEHKELITIAQHHGIPTRFLDLTYDPYVALYFAAEEAFKLLSSVNVSNRNNLDFLQINKFSVWSIDGFIENVTENRLFFLKSPTARNDYLNAQSGSFLTLSEFPFKDFTHNDIDIKEVIVKDHTKIVESSPGEMSNWPIIWKYNFPYGMACEILRKLDSRGINLLFIKPNLDTHLEYVSFKDIVNELWTKLPKEFKNIHSGF